MGTYGATIRQIRIQKGYTMKQVAKGIISVSFLSKFERGESEISISSFVQILARLSVTFDECQYMHRKYEPEPLEDFFAEMRKAYERRDLAKLHHLKKKELQKWESYQLAPYRCNALAIEVFENMVQDKAIDDVDKGALSILYDYLFRVEIWGYYELMLYNSTILLMPTEMVVTLSKTAYKKSGRYQQMKAIKDVIFRIMVNTLIHLLGPVNIPDSKVTRYTQECTYFFSCLDKLCADENQLFEKVQILYIKGAYQIKTGNRETGESKVREAISILKRFGSHGTANNIEHYLELTLAYLQKR